jgi:two-component system response regulator FixJ
MKEHGAQTVFIVDDDEAVRGAMKVLMLSFGWKVKTYASGPMFLDAISKAIPDCVLLDLNMPDMSGAEVQEALRARGIAVPVIVVTSCSDAQLLSRAQAAGIREMLGKPFHDEDLKCSLDRVLRSIH